MKKIILTLVFISLLSSCDKDYLNEPKPTSTVNSEVIFNSRDGADAFMSGILRRSRSQFTATDSGGLYSMYFARVNKGNDLVLGQMWYLFDYANDNREPTYRRTKFSWEYPYYMINQLNIFIKGVKESESLSQKDADESLGQAYAMRAFHYFQLALEFQHAYNYDPTLPAPPIYDEPAKEGKPMSTMKELYDFIVADLTQAVALTPETRINKSYVDKSVANGILARVYQTMDNWSGAETAAANAQIGYSLNAAEYGNGFDDMSSSEWMWAMPQTSDQSNYYYIAPHAFTDNVNDGYGLAFWNTDFVNLFSETDVRNTFFDIYGVGDSPVYYARASSKVTFSFTSDIPIMRSAEMLLIEAEAKARLGNDTAAANLLYELQSDRDPNAVASGNTGNALIEEILVERRKELYGEIGVEWFDAKRLRRGITRTGNHRVKDPASLTADDKKFFLKIPQVEIDANENIDDSVNSNR